MAGKKDVRQHSPGGSDIASSSGISRRGFLQLVTAGLASTQAPRLASASPSFPVGVGHLNDPYAATLRAVDACGQWPSASLIGRTVVIKPNLVYPGTAERPATTDPQVVRALVDLALQDGAAQILIVEGGPYGACFSECGYDFFDSYDPLGRVRLTDLNDCTETLVTP